MPVMYDLSSPLTPASHSRSCWDGSPALNSSITLLMSGKSINPHSAGSFSERTRHVPWPPAGDCRPVTTRVIFSWDEATFKVLPKTLRVQPLPQTRPGSLDDTPSQGDAGPSQGDSGFLGLLGTSFL